MKYGYFDEVNREYIITNPRTPVKWINYIGTRAFGGFVDHTGGALICKDDPTLNRITKYIQQMPSSDFKGETLYLRHHTQAGLFVFSPFFVPTLDEPDRYECHIGLGYTRILTEMHGVRTEATIFVPQGELCELRDIRVTNIGGEPVTIDAIPVVEYTHPNALTQYTNADWVPQTMQSKMVKDGESTILLQYPFMYRDTQVNFFTSNLSATSFETDRKEFLGGNEYGSFRNPISLRQSELGSHEANRGDNIAALLIPLGEMKPGETRRLITQLGQAASVDAAHRDTQRYRHAEEVEKELARLAKFWKGYLETIQVKTPDANMDVMLNLFNPYQCYVTKNWSRYLSYYQLGLGSRGIGMRDSCQDILSVMAAAPSEAKEFLRTLLSFQKGNGSAIHQFNPLSLEGSEGDSLELEDRPNYYSDDHLWLVLATCALLKETGDLEFLDEMIPFYEKDKQGKAIASGTVRQHLQRALEFTRNDVGQHGLPLLGFADWNDTVNLPKGAESLFTAHLYGKALLEMIELCEKLGDSAAADLYHQAHVEMKSRFEAVAWDGDWYVRYFDAEGAPLGSSKNQYGHIYLNGQSWAVISGFALPERAKQAMESVYRKLNTRYGIKLSAPGFDGYDAKYGGITTYPPGAKENGGIFLHPNPWAIIAETLLGNGDRAYEYYAQINPIAKNDSIDLYECEPYVYAQNILGDEHPQFGLGRNSWLSGTASWCYQAGTQWILGIRSEYDGLRVDPCIPKNWPGFTVTRQFRGQTYQISVHNPDGVSKGVAKMTMDGKEVAGNLIPIEMAGKKYKVEVWLGEVKRG
jgi:cellobiose phosphorylase